MNPRVSSAPAETRHPILQSLALAVLGVALVGALIMGAAVFAVLLGIFVVGYLLKLAHAWWRLFRFQRRAAYVDASLPQPAPAKTEYLEGEYDVVEATADAARRGSGGPA
jgi:hypothetical protein